MSYRRILTIQDISCVGQCSMTVALPVMSACGHEVCILPSAMLSTHTGGFGVPAVKNLTDMMADIRSHWESQGITFDLIYTGYLGSMEAIEEAKQIMDSMLAPGGIIVVDPAMADHGKLYRGFDEAYARAMTALCSEAHVVLPNITEAAMMSGLPFRENYGEAYIRELLESIPGRDAVLTGVSLEPGKTGFAVRCGGEITVCHHERVEKSYHGTGDLFAAAFVGALAGGKEMFHAAQIAAEFTLTAIRNTYRQPAHWYGVKFETALPKLMELLNEE